MGDRHHGETAQTDTAKEIILHVLDRRRQAPHPTCRDQGPLGRERCPTSRRHTDGGRTLAWRPAARKVSTRATPMLTRPPDPPDPAAVERQRGSRAPLAAEP